MHNNVDNWLKLFTSIWYISIHEYVHRRRARRNHHILYTQHWHRLLSVEPTSFSRTAGQGRPATNAPIHLHGNTQPREGKLVPWKQELENKRIAESILTSHLKGSLWKGILLLFWNSKNSSTVRLWSSLHVRSWLVSYFFICIVGLHPISRFWSRGLPW